LGLTYVNDIKYVKYGIVLKDDKKMSTPKGNVVKLYYIFFQGKTGPHLQYTDVWIDSIIKNQKIDLNNLEWDNPQKNS
jgi:arginyl-tRNA synthetase